MDRNTHLYTLVLYLRNRHEAAGYMDQDSSLRILTPLTREVLIDCRKGVTPWKYTILRDAIELDKKETMRVFYDADDYNRFENI